MEGKVILEQSVEQIGGAHKKQIQTYLRLFGLKLGFLLNFGETLMKEVSRGRLTVLMTPNRSWAYRPCMRNEANRKIASAIAYGRVQKFG